MNQYQYIYLYNEGSITVISDDSPNANKEDLIRQAYNTYVEKKNKKLYSSSPRLTSLADGLNTYLNINRERSTSQNKRAFYIARLKPTIPSRSKPVQEATFAIMPINTHKGTPEKLKENIFSFFDDTAATVTIQYTKKSTKIAAEDISKYQPNKNKTTVTIPPTHKITTSTKKFSFYKFINILFRHTPITPINHLPGGLDNNADLITYKPPF